MSITDKRFELTAPSELSLLQVDNYTVPSGMPSLEQTGDNTIILKNINDNPNTENFYGDGRHGDLFVSSTTDLMPHSFYFESYEDHPVYGPILKNVWFRTVSPFEAGEYVISKKHVLTNQLVDDQELNRWEIVRVKEIIYAGADIHYALESPPSIVFDLQSCNAGSLVYQFRSVTIAPNTTLQFLNRRKVSAGGVRIKSPNMIAAGWVKRTASDPEGIVVIKSQNGIEMRSGAVLWNSYGHGGTSGASTYLSYPDAFTGLVYPRGPLASPQDGSDRYAMTSSYTTRYYSRLCPGGPGLNGISSTFFSYGRKLPVPTDLNRNLFLGLGGATYGNSYGRAGGGAFVIQTPHLIMRSNAQINVRGHQLLDNNTYNIHGGCGSVLLKANRIEIENNLNWHSETSGRAHIIMSHSQAGTGTNGETATPGLCQFEFEELKYTNPDLTVETLVPSALQTNNTLKRIIFSVFPDIERTIAAVVAQPTIYDMGGETWVYQGNYLSRPFTDVAPVYNTGRYYKLRTHPLKTIPLSGWYSISEFSNICEVPDGTDIRFLFSRDTGTTWHGIDFSGVEPVLVASTLSESDIGNKGNTPADLNYINSSVLTKLFIEPQLGETNPTLDVMIAFKTTKSYVTPVYRRLWVVGDLASRFDDSLTGTEFHIPNLYTLERLSVETDVSYITKDLTTNVEFNNIINGLGFLDFEHNTPSIESSRALDIETVAAAPMDEALNVEFARTVESYVIYQTKIIPLAKSNTIWQVFIRSVAKPPLDMESNITIILDPPLALEVKTVKEAIDTINTEFHTGIIQDSDTSIETMVELLAQTEANLEAMVEIPLHELLNLECFAQFELKTALDIEHWIADLDGVDLLNQESFISIENEMQLIAEAFVSTVNKPIALEFDILDLVYYFLRRGYNIFPWLYSEAKGKWDTTQQQNWDKSTQNTTVQTGLFTQLLEKGYKIPECVNTSPSHLDGFGLVLPNRFTETPVAGQFLFFEHLGNEDTLVLGKKNIAQPTNLSAGTSLYIYQGTYDSNSVKMFNEWVRPHLINETCTMVWDPVSGNWANLKEQDHPLYWFHDYEGKTHMMPYVFSITADESVVPNS